MRARRLAIALLLWLPFATLATFAGSAGPASGAAPLEQLEGRVHEAQRAFERRIERIPLVGPVSDRLHVSGSWLGTWWEPASGSQVRNPKGRDFHTWDARVFVDADLLRDVRIGERTLLGSVGISFEWEFYRIGMHTDQVGDLYLDLQALGGSPWWNVQIGRFQIPVGESYLRYGKATAENPFITQPVAGTWWWDEGVRIQGRRADGRWGYVASVTSGETPRNWKMDGGGQVTGKLFWNPTSWAHVSASALWSGREGGDGEAANGGLWLGETWARSFGSGSGVPNLQDGRVVADGPLRLDGTWFLGADAILTHPRGARLWLSGGRYAIDSSGGGAYDRTLYGFIAELLVEGRAVSPQLRRFYAALRASGLGTWKDDEGYLLDVRFGGAYGYDMESLSAYSLAVGWRALEWVTLKVEATYQDVDLVDGAGSIGLRAKNASYLGAALGLHF